MARTPGVRSESKTLYWLIAGAAAYSLVIVACFLLTFGLTSWGESTARVQERRAADADSTPPQELLQVPEVDLFQLPKNLPLGQARNEIQNWVNKSRQMNNKQQDAFLLALIKERKDLEGLPFKMGKECRMGSEVANSFGQAVRMVRTSLNEEQSAVPLTGSADPVSRFWGSWQGMPGRDTAGAGVAALTQMLGPEKVSRRQALAVQMGSVDHPKATQTLAKQAVFDFDRRVRLAAIEGLKKRPNEDYTDVLMQGIRYPWANAATFASQAIVKLGRRDMVPLLVDFLDEADPRDPFEAKCENGECTFKVREVVRVNHHRNCLLCHSATTSASFEEIPGLIPSPGESFPPPTSEDAYGNNIPPSGPAIRADVTYLRQDFSVLQPVANAAPWPHMQRFDFVVRTRELSDDELRERVQEKQARRQDYLSPNHQAALEALRQLTGKDAGTTATAWRQELNLARK